MLAIKDNKIIGIFNEDVQIKEEGGVIKEDNQFYAKYEHTDAQKKLIKEMEKCHLEGRIVEIAGINVKYVRIENGKCEECPFSISNSDDWEVTLEACMEKCKHGYRFEITN